MINILKFLLLVATIFNGYNPGLGNNKSTIHFDHISLADGLSHSTINAICQDSIGFIWLATDDGLQRYDGTSLKTYKNTTDTNSLSNNQVMELYLDSEGRLWVGTMNGLNLYNQYSDNFTRIYLSNETPASNVIRSINEGGDKKIYVGTHFGLFVIENQFNKSHNLIDDFETESFASTTGKVTAINERHALSIIRDNQNNILVATLGPELNVINTSENSIKLVNYQSFLNNKYQGALTNPMRKVLFEDSDKNIWIGTESMGVIKWNRKNNSFSHILLPKEGSGIGNIPIHCFYQKNKNELWMGTDGAGIFIYNVDEGSFSNIRHDPGNQKSLSNNVVYDIFSDKSGIIWIGTFHSGVNKYTPSIAKFGRVIYDQSDEEGLSYPIVSSIFKDNADNLWVGTDGGGLNLKKPNGSGFIHYRHKYNDLKTLSSNTIISICQDSAENMWFGTWGGGVNRMNIDGTFTRFIVDNEKTGTITNNNIWDLYCDNKGRVWLATFGSGINVYIPALNKFYSYIPYIDSINNVQAKTVNCLFADADNVLWVGTTVGIIKVNLNQYKENPDKINYKVFSRKGIKLNDKRVNAIHQDKRGYYWFGTNSDGLQCYDPNSKSVKSYTISDGMPSNTIRSILEANDGTLWVSMSTNLIKFNPLTEEISVYEAGDGLQSAEFTNAHFKDANGKLFFGGTKGYNAFFPDDISPNKNLANVVITGIRIYNKPVRSNQQFNNRILLKNDITVTNNITLKHDEGFITFTFAALEFTNPSKNQYAYKLEGLEENWNYVMNRNEAVYTGLSPGSYLFKVKASNNDDIWTEGCAEMEVTVLPPWWKTWWALLAYIVLLLILLFALIKFILYQERKEHRIEVERLNAEKFKELTEMKLMFYTNVSHEFKTPLTLIIAPLKKLMQQELDGSAQKQVNTIYKNSKRLLRLINQFIDIRKLDKGELKIEPHYGDLVKYINEICFSFKEYAEENHIKLTFKSLFSRLNLTFDKDKIEKILFNLLSNSFKFTPPNGHIEVVVKPTGNNSPMKYNKRWENYEMVDIIVKDNGDGIPDEHLSQIFKRFYKLELESSDNYKYGSGIGLSLVKKLVEIHQGEITIKSKVNEGTVVKVTLPFKKDAVQPLDDDKEDKQEVEYVISANTIEQKSEVDERPSKTNTNFKTLLIVEDNFELRSFLKDHFVDKYNVLLAGDGKKGWEVCKNKHPDLIISDVMMPEMDGIQLCEQVKSDHETSHIPVVLLTAKTSEIHVLEGLNKGADDYISKPFSVDVLELKLNNILKNRQKLIEHFTQGVAIQPSKISITPADEEFINKALSLVENNMSNSEFSVEKLAFEVGMNRGSLSRKLQSLTTKTPVEFIRTIRLKRAAQYLEKSQLNISEICYKVGFNDPVYFRKIFKKEFSQTPSDFRKNQGKA